MDVPTWAQPPCEMPPTPMPTPRPTRSPTPRPTRRPTPPPPPTRRPTSRPTPTPPPPTILPVCDLRVAPWERPPCRLVLPPCNPLLAPSQQAACQVKETEVPTQSPTMVSLLQSTSNGGCGSNGCEECEGDCDSDADCVGDLVCFQRTAFEFVRGCGGGGTGGENVFRVCSVPSILSSVVCWVPFEFDCSSEIFIAISHPFSSCGFSFSVPTPALSGWDYCAKELPPCDSFPEETSCTDGDARCASWASGGECQRNPSYMNTSCAKSCSICTPTERPPCRTAAPTMAPTLPLCDTTIPPWERPPCVDPLPPCQTNMELWEQAPCTPHWSVPLRPGQNPVLPSRSGGIGDSEDAW